MSWPFWLLAAPAPTSDAVLVAKRSLTNVEAAWAVCQQPGTPPFYVWCALLDQETKGKNIFGHDEGGVFSYRNPYREVEVTATRYAEFYQRVVVKGETSNGVGPAQLTYRGFFPELKKLGLRGESPYDTMLFGARLLQGYLVRGRREHPGNEFRWAGTWYNAGPNERTLVQPYADHFAGLVASWAQRLGQS